MQVMFLQRLVFLPRPRWFIIFKVGGNFYRYFQHRNKTFIFVSYCYHLPVTMNGFTSLSEQNMVNKD